MRLHTGIEVDGLSRTLHVRNQAPNNFGINRDWNQKHFFSVCGVPHSLTVSDVEQMLFIFDRFEKILARLSFVPKKWCVAYFLKCFPSSSFQILAKF